MTGVTTRNNVALINSDGQPVDWPLTTGIGILQEKKSPRFNPDLFPPGYVEWMTGAFDDLSTGQRGQGDLLQLSVTDPGEHFIEGQFFEHVLLAAGNLAYDGAQIGDHVTWQSYAPASAPTSAGGSGNADKVGSLVIESVTTEFQVGETVTGGTSGHSGMVAAVGGTTLTVMNTSGSFESAESVTGNLGGAAVVATPIAISMFIPNGSGTGAYTVDGGTMTVGEVNENLVPVPNKFTAGYWDWNPDDNPSITPNATQTGSVDLYDTQIVIGQQVNRVGILGSGARRFGVPNVRPAHIYPHWKQKLILWKASDAGVTLSVAVEAVLGRRSTAP